MKTEPKKCPNCKTLMSGTTRTIHNGQHLWSTYLCAQCLHRETATADNPRWPALPKDVEKPERPKGFKEYE